MSTKGHFEWDEKKSTSNVRKHGVSFTEAMTVFYDPYSDLYHDPDHSLDEDRFILLGMSQSMRILVVNHNYRSNQEIIRIISARKASRMESRNYGR